MLFFTYSLKFIGTKCIAFEHCFTASTHISISFIISGTYINDQPFCLTASMHISLSRKFCGTISKSILLYLTKFKYISLLIFDLGPNMILSALNFFHSTYTRASSGIVTFLIFTMKLYFGYP